jgi:predicted nucleic acid-binding Zn ribbon protein
MRRKNAQTIGEVIRDFLEENKFLQKKIHENRIEHAWVELLGDMVMRYTRSFYVRNRVLYVSLSSSVIRNELALSREHLVKSLNKQAGAEVIDDIVIR